MKTRSILITLCFFFAGFALLSVACGGDDDDSPGITAPASDDSGDTGNGDDANDANEHDDGSTDAQDLIDSLDFGDGAATVTIGDEQYEFELGGNITIDGTTYIGVCQSLFGLIAGEGYDPEGSELGISFEIPPTDWESYDDGRFDTNTPKIEIEGVRHESLPADDPNPGGWRADIEWQESRDTVAAGASQIDAWELKDSKATGTATFLAVNYFGEPIEGAQPIQGTFALGCAED